MSRRGAWQQAAPTPPLIAAGAGLLADTAAAVAAARHAPLPFALAAAPGLFLGTAAA